MNRLLAIGACLGLASGCASLAGLDDYAASSGSGGSTATGSVSSSSSAGGSGGQGGASTSSSGGGGMGGSGGGVVLPTYSEAVLADAPLGYWPLDTVADGETPDVNPVFPRPFSVNNMVSAAAPLATHLVGSLELVSPQPNGFLSQDGLPFKFQGKQPFSLELWFVDVMPGATNFLFGRGGNDANGYQGYRINVDEGTLEFLRYRNGSANRASLDGIVVNRSYHLLARYDDDCLCLFLLSDAEPPRSDCTPVSNFLNDDSNFPFRIGASGGHVGFVDEAAVYAMALPHERMMAHHQAATGEPVTGEFAVTSCP